MDKVERLSAIHKVVLGFLLNLATANRSTFKNTEVDMKVVSTKKSASFIAGLLCFSTVISQVDNPALASQWCRWKWQGIRTRWVCEEVDDKARLPFEQRSPYCSSTYNPQDYMPGTPGWTGRGGKIAFNNGTTRTVVVKLYAPPGYSAPNSPSYLFNSWNVNPGENKFLGDRQYGMHFGIQVDDSPICILGPASDWNYFNGEYIFQTWPQRIR